MRKLIGILVLLLLVLSAYRPAHADTSKQTTGLIIPLYSYPNSEWTSLVQQAQANPSIPIVAVVNVHYGPGWPEDYYFASQVQLLQTAGIKVVGYDWTGYGSMGMDWVKTLIQEWVSWYHVSGIFFDGMANAPGEESYYSNATAYAHSLGANLVIGNPGADISPTYIGTVDTIVVYENFGLAPLSFLGGWHTVYSKSNFAFMSYGVSSANQTYIDQASQYVAWEYITDSQMPNPYLTLPSYMSTMISELAAPPPPPPPTTSIVNVFTVSKAQGGLFGMYTTLWQNGTMLQTCFSPCSFTLTPGAKYTVQVADWAVFLFQHWNDNSTIRIHDFIAPIAGGSATWTASYS